MNRAERRRKDRQDNKDINQGGDMKSFQMEVELIQPWSNFIMRTTLPPEILDAMIRITDEILADKNKMNWGPNLAGQIADEPLIPHSILQREGIYGFFLETVGEYVKNAIRQQATSADYHKVKDIEWMTKMMSMWIISQKDNEYNPCHIHTDCAVSSVMYLKVPDMLPSTKPERDDDGCIVFIGSAAPENRFTRQQLKVKPSPGDFLMFPAHQLHSVYPFRTEDGKGERRSVSYNADFMSKQAFEDKNHPENRMAEAQAKSSNKSNDPTV